MQISIKCVPENVMKLCNLEPPVHNAITVTVSDWPSETAENLTLSEQTVYLEVNIVRFKGGTFHSVFCLAGNLVVTLAWPNSNDDC